MRQTRRRFLIGACAFAWSCAQALGATRPLVIDGTAFGASWRISLPEDADTRAIRPRLEAIITSVNRSMSPFQPSSEISGFNNGTFTHWMPVSAQTQYVVAQALRIAHLTNGAFDPTIGATVGRYGFGPISRHAEGNYKDIALKKKAIKKAFPGMSVDLCGIAKGYALDRMVHALDDLGISNYLIELGGEVVARGQHPSNRVWQVGIEHPIPEPISFRHIVHLRNEALASSGDGVNGYTFSGRRYGHIIDPRALAPADNGIASVSVIAPTAILADALATALFVMGPKAGPAFATQEALPALFVLRHGHDFKDIMTHTFTDRLLV